jgi:hypothetical protein
MRRARTSAVDAGYCSSAQRDCSPAGFAVGEGATLTGLLGLVLVGEHDFCEAPAPDL